MDLLTVQPEPSDAPRRPLMHGRLTINTGARRATTGWRAASLRLRWATAPLSAPARSPTFPQIRSPSVDPLLFPYARTYCSSSRRRNAIQRRVLDAIPGDCELVILEDSLGSVVAADLLYHLPKSCTCGCW